jgi:hypothetical protein
MIRLQDIQTALMNVVGWQQDYNPQNQIDPSLCESESGLTFQGAHPLCTLANVRAIMPDDYLFKYPNWKNNDAYAIGAKVKHQSKIWIAKAANAGSEPADNNPDWAEYNIVSDFVRQLTINGINTAVQTFIQEKQLQQETRNLLERRTFFDGAARLQATIDPTGKIVGFEIVPVRSMGVTTKIERIGLQMIGATGKVKLYLFHSSQVAPMRTIELDFTNTKGELVAYCHGHDHKDADYTRDSIKDISTRCDGVEEHDEADQAVRVKGTITEQSFDVFTVNKAERKIYATKIGAGADRVISY